MNKDFFEYIFKRHQQIEAVPSNKEIAGWALGLIRVLFPEQSNSFFNTAQDIEAELNSLRNKLRVIMDSTRACKDCDNEQASKKFFDQVPELYRALNTDINSILDGDPAATNEFEVIRTYPGFYAISFYRVAHALLKLNVPLLPRILTEYAHSKTGIDIHPGAVIGDHLYIDHGTGIVIGETTEIGCNVKLYQGVTLGALSVEKTMAARKRHPTVKDNVVIYSGATILGGDTVIGENSIIGGNVWLTKSVPAGSVVYHETQFKVVERKL